jgi:hypothetical protein
MGDFFRNLFDTASWPPVLSLPAALPISWMHLPSGIRPIALAHWYGFSLVMLTPGNNCFQNKPLTRAMVEGLLQEYFSEPDDPNPYRPDSYRDRGKDHDYGTGNRDN